MEKNKFDRRIMNIRTGLGLVGIQVDLKVAYLINKFMIAFNEEGSELTLDELTDIKFKAEKFLNGEVIERKMTLKDLKGIAINCKTRNESDEVLKLLDKLGAKWGLAPTCSERHLSVWNRYKSKTCYIPFGSCGFGYDRIGYFETEGCSIKSARWFIENFTPKDKEEIK